MVLFLNCITSVGILSMLFHLAMTSVMSECREGGRGEGGKLPASCH